MILITTLLRFSGIVIPHRISAYIIWCPLGDSNSHALRRQNLNLVRLPIPPKGHYSSSSNSSNIKSQFLWLILLHISLPHNATLVSPNQYLAFSFLQISQFPEGAGQPFVRTVLLTSIYLISLISNLSCHISDYNVIALYVNI